MPQVPYSPVPTERPSQQATPGFNVPAVGDAFGVGVAQAVQGLGSAVEGAGNELFARAVALQQLSNETEAKEADAKYMIGAGELHAKYNSLTGKDAVTAYPQYAKDLQELRQKIRGSLPNDAARRAYDSQSLSTMGRSIFNGAGHAASQNKQWAIGTLTSQADLDIKTIEDNPQDEALFQQKRARVISSTAQAVGLAKGEHDPESPIVKDAVLKATSSMRASQLIGLSRTNPEEARKKLDMFRGELTEPDFLKVDGIVTSKAHAVGSVNIATRVLDRHLKEDGTYDVDTLTLQREAQEEAKKVFPNDPVLPKLTTQSLDGLLNQRRYAKKQDDNEAIQTYKDAVAKGPDGNGVKTVQELLAIPGMDKLVQRLPPSVRNDMQGYINRFNKQRDQVTRDETKIRLNGLFNNTEDSAAREEALNLDLTKEKLSATDIMRFQDKLRKLLQNTQADPRVQEAVRWMQQSRGAELEALGIFKRTDANKEQYDHFRGAVQSAIEVFKEDHKRAPSYKEFMDQIAPRLLQTRDTSWTPLGRIWPTNTPFFEQTKDASFEKFATRMREDFDSRQLGKPSDEEIYKAYVRIQYIKLYSKKKPNG